MTAYLLFDRELEISLGEFDTLWEAQDTVTREDLKNYSIWHDGKMVVTFPVEKKRESK